MARFTIATTAADPVRPYLEGVAKSLVDRLYGDKGPALKPYSDWPGPPPSDCYRYCLAEPPAQGANGGALSRRAGAEPGRT